MSGDTPAVSCYVDVINEVSTPRHGQLRKFYEISIEYSLPCCPDALPFPPLSVDLAAALVLWPLCRYFLVDGVASITSR